MLPPGLMYEFYQPHVRHCAVCWRPAHPSEVTLTVRCFGGVQTLVSRGAHSSSSRCQLTLTRDLRRILDVPLSTLLWRLVRVLDLVLIKSTVTIIGSFEWSCDLEPVHQSVCDMLATRSLHLREALGTQLLALCLLGGRSCRCRTQVPCDTGQQK